MSAEFYILKNGIKSGPFSIEELGHQNISPNTMTWRMGFESWISAKQVPELQSLVATLPPDPVTINSMPKTWFVESILVTLCCCMPFGIVGIVNSTKVESSYMAGNYSLAKQYSNNAKKWVLWGFFIALAGVIAYLIFLAILFLFAINQ